MAGNGRYASERVDICDRTGLDRVLSQHRPQAVNWQTVFPAFWPVVLVIFSGVFATAIGNMIWNRAIAELGASRTTLYQYWVPVFGVGFALILLGEAFTIWHAVGLVCILLGTYLGTRRV